MSNLQSYKTIKSTIRSSLLVTLTTLFILTTIQSSESAGISLNSSKASASVCKKLYNKINPKLLRAVEGNVTDLNSAKINSDNFLKVSKAFTFQRKRTKGQMRALYRDASIQTRNISDVYFEVHLLQYAGMSIDARLEQLKVLNMIQDFYFTLQDIYEECP